MTRREQLQFCKVCIHQKFDSRKGLLCGLTNEYAHFEKECGNIQLIEGKQLPEIQTPQSKPKKKRSFKFSSVFKAYPRADYLNAITILLASSMLLRLLNYSFELSEWIYNSILIFGIYILTLGLGFTQISDSNKISLLFRKLQFVFLIALGTAILNIIYVKLCLPYPVYFFKSFLLFLFLAYIGYLLSLLLKLFLKTRLSTKLRKSIIVITSTILLLLGLLESAALIPNEEIYWHNNHQLSLDDFKGIPNYLSGYTGVMYSTLDIQFISTDSLFIPAYCRADKSWIKKSNSNDYLVNHELYHFNISEFIARKTRKKISEDNRPDFSEFSPWLFSSTTYRDLNELQNKYDYDTQHGINPEAQMEWQFLIDSLLLEYDAYNSPYIIKTAKPEKQFSHFRKLNFNNNFEYSVSLPVSEMLRDKVDCYEVSYDKGERITRIVHKLRGNVVPDENGKQIVRITYSDKGETYMNFDPDGNPATTSSGIYGFKLIRENEKLTLTNLNSRGKPMEDQFGTAYEIYLLNEEDDIEFARFFDLKRRPSTNKFGFQNVRYVYNSNGNIEFLENYSADGELANNDEGYASLKFKYDPFNNIQMIELFDDHERIAEDANGIAKIKWITDRNGHTNCEAYYNKYGQLLADEQGIAYKLNVFDDYGNVLQSTNYGRNRNIILDEKGYGRVIREYDSLQRVVRIKNYDAYYMLSSVAEGFAVREIEYKDETKNHQIIHDYISRESYVEDLETWQRSQRVMDEDKIVELIYLDDSLKPSINQDSIARISYVYDSLGREISKVNYAIDDQLLADKNGIAYEHSEYDQAGNLVAKFRYDTKNQLLVSDTLAAIERFSYDDAGRTTSEKYYNASGQLADHKRGYASCTYTYNLKLRSLLIEYFDSQGNRVPAFNQVAVIKQNYNARGNVQQVAYFNDDLAPQPDSSGSCIIAYEYDKADRLTLVRYFDENHAPIITNEGYSEFHQYYDKNDNIIIQQGYDNFGQLVEDSSGIATYYWGYDRNGNLVDSKLLSREESNLEELLNSGFNIQYAWLPPSQIFDSYNSYTASTAYHTTTNRYSQSRTLTTWYKNNRKESEGTYINGKLEGTYITWYESGQMQSKVDYENGMMNGYYITYHENGKVESMRLYKNNTLVVEEQQTWYDDGQLRSEYVNGEYLEYDREGNRII